MPEANRVHLVICNVLGEQARVLEDAEKLPGTHVIVWDGYNDAGAKVAAGAYLFRLEVGDQVRIKKDVVVAIIDSWLRTRKQNSPESHVTQ